MKHAVAFMALVGCAESAPTVSTLDQDTTVCGVGSTVKGIDVSKYDMTIDWPAVKNDGVEYAFVRVSDGTMFPDMFFDANWAGSRAAGIKHGAYQFFRPSEDPIVQADMLLNKIGGGMAVDDLPPVVDVEATDDQPPAVIIGKLHAWIDRVAKQIGREPIVYTGRNFWRDSVASAEFAGYPLWHAQYSTAICPNLPDPWATWYFWQYTETGTVAGITTAVDINRWNGTHASFDAFLGPSGSGDWECGDGVCTAGEDASSCPADCPPCGLIPPTGGKIDDGDACFEGGGKMEYLRQVTTAGEGSDLLWTHTSDNPEFANYAKWNLFLTEAGRYRVEVYTDAAYAQSKLAKYAVEAGGASTEVVIDQTAVNGWQSLGELDFTEGGFQSVRVGDNTGEPGMQNVQIVFDALRLTRVGKYSAADDGGSDWSLFGGCDAGGSVGLSWLAALLGLRRRRSR